MSVGSRHLRVNDATSRVSGPVDERHVLSVVTGDVARPQGFRAFVDGEAPSVDIVARSGLSLACDRRLSASHGRMKVSKGAAPVQRNRPSHPRSMTVGTPLDRLSVSIRSQLVRVQDADPPDLGLSEECGSVQFQQYDLGSLKKGSRVIVTLKNQANVRLMTQSEFNKYKRGGAHRYIGGLVKRSPWTGVVPSAGRWFIAVDLGGYSGRVQSSVRVEGPPPGFLPTARDAAERLRDIQVREPEEPVGDVLGGQTWDVFISHASEDKDAVALPLRNALAELGVTVWLDKTELRDRQAPLNRSSSGQAGAQRPSRCSECRRCRLVSRSWTPRPSRSLPIRACP